MFPTGAVEAALFELRRETEIQYRALAEHVQTTTRKVNLLGESAQSRHAYTVDSLRVLTDQITTLTAEVRALSAHVSGPMRKRLESVETETDRRLTFREATGAFLVKHRVVGTFAGIMVANVAAIVNLLLHLLTTRLPMQSVVDWIGAHKGAFAYLFATVVPFVLSFFAEKNSTFAHALDALASWGFDPRRFFSKLADIVSSMNGKPPSAGGLALFVVLALGSVAGCAAFKKDAKAAIDDVALACIFAQADTMTPAAVVEVCQIDSALTPVVDALLTERRKAGLRIECKK